jgi:phosphatidylserine decarboxylase
LLPYFYLLGVAMRAASLSLTPEGLPVIGLTALSSLIFALIGCWPMALLFLVLCWFSCHFFRDPERVTPQAAGLAVSPADGKVIRIEPRQDPITGERRLCISIFMNVFSVHVNRAPVAGTVEAIRYFSGAFVNAAWDKAATDNERCAYLLRDAEGQAWTMVQIAGLIARRIVCRVDEGDSLARGQRYGMIRFGSRVDLYVPEEYTVVTTIGEQVYAGESVLASKA